jgi:peptidoglycan hydrolase CwlO-like protein
MWFVLMDLINIFSRFNSIEEAVSYWKQLALQRKEDYEKLEAEYFEFTDQSRALEEQQETQFEKFENELAQKTKELKIAREELRDLKEASVEQARTAQGDIQQLQVRYWSLSRVMRVN